MVYTLKQMLRIAKYLTRDCSGYVLWDYKPVLSKDRRKYLEMYVLGRIGRSWCKITPQQLKTHFGNVILDEGQMRTLPLSRATFRIIQAGQ